MVHVDVPRPEASPHRQTTTGDRIIRRQTTHTATTITRGPTATSPQAVLADRAAVSVPADHMADTAAHPVVEAADVAGNTNFLLRTTLLVAVTLFNT